MKKIKKDIIRIINEENSLKKTCSFYINTKDKRKLHEMVEQIATDCCGLPRDVSYDVATDITNGWLPTVDIEAERDYGGCSCGNETEVEIEPQEIVIEPEKAELTSNPSNFSELTKCFDVIMKNFKNMKKEIMDIYYNSISSLQSNNTWSPYTESLECKLAMDDVKMLLGIDITNKTLNEMASCDKRIVVKNENKVVLKIYEWMKQKEKTTKKVLISENSKLAKNKELKYWNLKLDTFDKFKESYDSNIIEKAWRHFLLNAE